MIEEPEAFLTLSGLPPEDDEALPAPPVLDRDAVERERRAERARLEARRGPLRAERRWMELGEVELALGDADAALAAFEEGEGAAAALGAARARLAGGLVAGLPAMLEEVAQRHPEERRAARELAADALQRLGRHEDEVDACVALVEAHPGDARALFRLGVAYTQAGRAELAARAFALALKHDPDCHEARLNLGSLRRGQGARAAATREFVEALRRRPGSWEAYYNLGFLYAQEGAFARAIWAYRGAFRTCPLTEALGGISYNLGLVCVELGRWREAADAFARAVDCQPDNTHYAFNLAVARARAGDADGARAAFDRVIAREPHYLKAHLGAAELELARGNGDEARRLAAEATRRMPEAAPLFGALAARTEALWNPSLQEARFTTSGGLPRMEFSTDVKLEPEAADVFFYQGLALARAGEGRAALAALEQGIAYDPNFARAYGVAARLARELGLAEKGFAYAARAAAQDPADVEAQVLLARCYLERGEARFALEACHEALAHDREAPEALRLQAFAHEQLGRRGEAVRRWARYVELYPADARGWRERARLADAPGERAQGLAACHAAFRGGVDDAEVYHNAGVLLLNEGQPAEAAIAFGLALELAPDAVWTLAACGLALQREGRGEEGRAALSRAVELAPEQADLHYDLGLAQQRDGLLAEAEASYRRALLLEPERLDALNNLALAIAFQGRAREGLRLIEQVRGRDGADGRWQLNHAALLDEAGLHAAAIELTAQLAASAPAGVEPVEVLWNLAQAHAGAGQYDRAVGHVRGVLYLDPGQPDALVNLGAWALAGGDYRTARQALLSATRLAPGDARVAVNMGVLLSETGARADAVRSLYERAAASSGDGADGLLNVGLMAARAGSFAEARSSFLKALELKPGMGEASLALAGVAQELGDSAAAIEHFRGALARDADAFAARLNLGALLTAAGELAEAREHLERAVALRPDSGVARYDLGALLEVLGEPAEAAAAYHLARDLDPSLAEPSVNLGLQAEGRGDLERAAAEYTRALEAAPADLAAYRLLGHALRRLGRPAEAQEVYASGLAVHPDDPSLRWGDALVRRDRGEPVELELSAIASEGASAAMLLEEAGDAPAAGDPLPPGVWSPEEAAAPEPASARDLSLADRARLTARPRAAARLAAALRRQLSTGQESASGWLDVAAAELVARRPEAALEALRRVEPGALAHRVARLRAAALLRLDRAEDALRLLTREAAREPGEPLDPGLVHDLAVAGALAGEGTRAGAMSTLEALAREGSAASARAYAWLAEQPDELDRAADLVLARLDAHPADGLALAALGRVLLTAGRPDEAADVWARARELLPALPSVAYNEALALELAGRNSEALERFTLLAFESEDPALSTAARVHRAALLVEAAQGAEASYELTRLVEDPACADPADWTLPFALGEARRLDGDAAGAAAAFRQAVVRAQGRAWEPACAAAQALVDAGHPHAAERLARRAAARWPAVAECALAQCAVLEALGRPADAATEAFRALTGAGELVPQTTPDPGADPGASAPWKLGGMVARTRAADPAASPPAEPDAVTALWLRAAELSAAAADPARAWLAAQRALARAPGSSASWRVAGRVLAALARPAAAWRALTLAVAIDPSDPSVAEELARLHVARGAHLRAERALDRAARRAVHAGSRRSELDALRGWLALRASQPRKAARLLKRAVRAGGARPEVRAALAAARLACGQPRAAARELEALLAAAPAAPTRPAAGAPPPVEPALGAALRAEPARPLPDAGSVTALGAGAQAALLVNLGVARGERGEERAELEAYAQALALVPDFAPAVLNAAHALAESGQREAAVELLEPLVADAALTPGQREIAVTLLLRLDRADLGLRALAPPATSTGAYGGDAANPARNHLHALALLRTGDEPGARAIWTALAAQPASAVRAHAALAQLAAERGDAAAERAHLDAALRADPRDPAARADRAALHLKQGEPARARELLEDDAGPTRGAAAAYDLALACAALGDRRSARRALARASRLEPGWDQPWLLRALLAFGDGKPAAARRALGRVKRGDLAVALRAVDAALAGRSEEARALAGRLPAPLGELLVGRPGGHEAYEAARALLRDAPGDPAAAGKAVELALRALERRLEAPEVFQLLAHAMRAAGDAAGARAAIEAGLEAHPRSPLLLAAAGRHAEAGRQGAGSHLLIRSGFSHYEGAAEAAAPPLLDWPSILGALLLLPDEAG